MYVGVGDAHCFRRACFLYAKICKIVCCVSFWRLNLCALAYFIVSCVFFFVKIAIFVLDLLCVCVRTFFN